MHTLDTTLSIPASCQNQLHPVMTKQATAGLSLHSHRNIQLTLITTTPKQQPLVRMRMRILVHMRSSNKSLCSV